jgi:hypothetical protein
MGPPPENAPPPESFIPPPEVRIEAAPEPKPTVNSVTIVSHPTAEPTKVAEQDHPRLISLKNHSAYTILSYWVRGKDLHFITTQGDHVEVPLTQVEHLYPRTKEDIELDKKLSPVNRRQLTVFIK